MMSIFVAFMVVGIAGLLAIALPGVARHGHAAQGGHAHAAHSTGHANAGRSSSGAKVAAANLPWWLQVLASPRVIFTLFALYGAFGNAFVGAAKLPMAISAVAAIVPAALVERLLVRPLWNKLASAGAEPCAPLEDLVLRDAVAVTPFANGHGIVEVEREGRAVQFTAYLTDGDRAAPIRVGDRLKVDDVDSKRERLTVSLH